MIVHDFTEAVGVVVERLQVGPHELVRFEGGEVRLRCVCSLWSGEVVVAAVGMPAHRVDWPAGGVPTVRPSIAVGGDEVWRPRVHGYVRDGEWVPCGDDRSVPLPAAGDDGGSGSLV